MDEHKIIIELIAKKYKTAEELVKAAANDEENEIWTFAKDYIQSKLEKDENYRWLSYKVFYFFNIVRKKMQDYLNNLIHFNIIFKKNNLVKYIKENNKKKVAKWIFDRTKSELKNLFDKRSKNNLIDCNVINFPEEELISSSFLVA